MNEAFVQSNARIFRWYMLLLQLAGNTFLCGIFGTLAGLLAVKIFRTKRSSLGCFCLTTLATLEIVQRAERFFDIRGAQNHEPGLRFRGAGEVGVLDVDARLGQPFGDRASVPGSLLLSIIRTSFSRASTPRSPRIIRALVGSLTTIRTTA